MSCFKLPRAGQTVGVSAEWTRTTLFCIPATQMAIDVTPRATKQLADLLQGGLWSATRKRTDPLQGGSLPSAMLTATKKRADPPQGGSLSSATLTATRKGADTVATSPSSWTLTVTVVKSQLRHDYTASSSPFPRFRKFDAFPFPLQFRNSARNSGIPLFTIGPCHLQPCQLPAFQLWTVYKLSLLACKHTHLIKAMWSNCCIGCCWVKISFNVVQSTYNLLLSCYNTHSISDTELWPLKVSQAKILREL